MRTDKRTIHSDRSKMAMIFDRHTVTAFDGLFVGRARIYEYPLTIITFARLSSDRAKIAALRLGFSPAINLPDRIPYEDGGFTGQWILDGETVQPVFGVYLSGNDPTKFFEFIEFFDTRTSHQAAV